MRTYEDVNLAFTYHPWPEWAVKRFGPLRDQARTLALAVAENLPETPERTLALRSLHRASMDINLAVTMALAKGEIHE